MMQPALVPAQPVQVCPAGGGAFQVPAGYMVYVMPVGMQVPPGAVPLPCGGPQAACGGFAQAAPGAELPFGCGAGPLSPQGCVAPQAGAGPKMEHQAPAGAGPKEAAACSAEPAPEPATEEPRPAPAADDTERQKRLQRLSPGGATSTSAAVLLAKRMQIMQARRGDRSTFGALNIDKPKEDKKAPQLRFLKELEEKKKKREELLRRGSASDSTAAPSEPAAAPTSDEDTSGAAGPPGPDFAASRAALLRYRRAAHIRKPKELKGFSVGVAPLELECLGELELRRQCSAPVPDAPARPAFQRQRTEPAPKACSPLAALRKELSELETLRRDVKSLLNKVCPEKFATVVEKLTAIRVPNTEALETIIELIFKKALSEPHYSETYADLVFSLRSVFPEFPSPDGGKPMTFKSSVLNICQAEFEELLAAPEPSESEKAGRQGEDLEMLCQERRGRMRANMRFVGHLFLRQLLSAKVVGGILRELVLCEMEDLAPQEHALECACELLNSVGFTLESMPYGQAALPVVFSRLRALKAMKGADGKGVYTKRMQFAIQDLIDTREAGWTRKVFRSSAKTMEEIRASKTKDQGGETVMVGQRPFYMTGEVERFIRTHTA